MIFTRLEVAECFDTAGEVLRGLAGIWSVRRLIVDHRAGAVRRFEGVLRLTEEVFEETGELALPGGTVAARRAYEIRRNEASVDVRFPDGSAFVTLDLRASQAVRHDCGADRYLGRLVFESFDAWVERWRVDGPAKRYSSLTRYRRIAGS